MYRKIQGLFSFLVILGLLFPINLINASIDFPDEIPYFDSGYFLVEEQGSIGIDFLFDGGGYKGEVAIFSLKNIETFEPGSEAFVKEVARRAMSGTTEGHVVISDQDEGAKYEGTLAGEKSRNSGTYKGVKTFPMTPGEAFGFMLVPNGRVKDVFKKPSIGGNKKPLFSIATANPSDTFHIGQIVDITGTGKIFAMEDLRVDGNCDFDYNDVVFKVTGAYSETVDYKDIKNDEDDSEWEESETGEEIIENEDPESEKKKVEDKKITICHYPPGNPEGRETIVIPVDDLDSYLNRGSVIGACEDNHKVTICHATSSETNPYVVISVNDNAVDGEGKNDHSHHEKDIIPIYDLNNDGVVDVADCTYNGEGEGDNGEEEDEQGDDNNDDNDEEDDDEGDDNDNNGDDDEEDDQEDDDTDNDEEEEEDGEDDDDELDAVVVPEDEIIQPVTEIIEEQPEVLINPEKPEELRFIKPTIQNLFSDCNTKRIVISNGRIEFENARITSLEYSINSGRDWFPVKDVQFDENVLIYNIETNALEDQLYGIKFRLGTDSKKLYVSELINFTHKCEGEVVILGNYFQNGYGMGVLSKEGDYLYNSSLTAKIYAETLGGVSRMRIRIASEESKLDESSIFVEMSYDHDANIWIGDLASELLKRELTYSRLEVLDLKGKVLKTKKLPRISNIDYSTKVEKSDEDEQYKYTIYFNDSRHWKKMEYEEALFETRNDIAFQNFNLTPGKYYIKVVYPNGRKYYTKKFTIDEPSLVKVETTKKDSNPIMEWLDPWIRHLDVEIYSKDYIVGEEKVENQNGVREERFKKRYQENKEYIGADQEQVLFLYWNRWNPQYTEQLDIIEEMLNDVGSNSKKEIVIYTDKNNIQELRRLLEVGHRDIKIIEVTDSNMLQEELVYQPEVVLYDIKGDEVFRLRSNLNYSELKEKLEYYNFI